MEIWDAMKLAFLLLLLVSFIGVGLLSQRGGCRWICDPYGNPVWFCDGRETPPTRPPPSCRRLADEG